MNLKRSLALAISVLMILTMPFAFGAGETLDRIAGGNRWETAVNISKEGWSSSGVVVLANGRNYPDALAGVPLAHALNAPILLTEADSLVAATKAEITRLGATKVIILGGTGVISEDVAKALTDMGLEVERIKGADRYETAAAIAAQVAPNGVDTVVLAYGRGYADALAAASYAAVNGYPILLTEKGALPAATKKAIGDLGATKVIVVGGTGVIAADAIAGLPGVTRVSGANREATSVALAEHFAPETDMFYLATGDGFADAITGAVLAAKNGTGILLVRSSLSKEVKGFLGELSELVVFGGTGAVSNAVANAAALALKQVDTSTLEVVSVTANNLKQFVVTFNQPVTWQTAEAMGNYDYTGKDVETAITPEYDFAVLSDDGQQVTVTLGVAKTQQATLNVTMKDIVSETGKKLAQVIKKVEFTDVARPTVVAAKIVAPTKLRVTFSEPINQTLAENALNYSINDGEYSASSVTAVDCGYGIVGDVYDITLGMRLPDGTYKLTVQNMKDAADWLMIKQNVNFTYQADTVKPTVSIKEAHPNKVVLQFSEWINPSGMQMWHSYWDYPANAGTLGAFNEYYNTIEVTFTQTLPAGPITIFIKPGSTVDAWGNKFADTKIELVGNIAIDTTKPTVSKVNVHDNQTIEVFFSESINSADAETITNYVLKNSAGGTVAWAAANPATYAAATKKVTLKTEDPMNGGTFELTVQGIKDLAAPVPNKMAKFVTAINVPDEISPKILGNAAVSNKLLITFDEPMKTSGAGSILDRNNYKFDYADGKSWVTLKSDVTLTAQDGGQSLLLTFPAGTAITGQKLRIEKVTDQAGNVLNEVLAAGGYYCELTATAEIAPTVMLDEGIPLVIATSRNTVEVWYDAHLSSVTATGFAITGNSVGSVRLENRTLRDGTRVGVVIITAGTKWETDATPAVSVTGATGTKSLLGTQVQNLAAADAIDEMPARIPDGVAIWINADTIQITFSEKLTGFSTATYAQNGFALSGEFTRFDSAKLEADGVTVTIKGKGFSDKTLVSYSDVAGIEDLKGNLLESFDNLEVYIP